MLGTADAAGLPYVSPKGDHNGFVMVLSPTTIVVPDRPGNSILMGLQNLLENPQCGICFEIPGNTTTLRVGGVAELRKDPELLRRLAACGTDATMAIKIHIKYAFFHCPKAYLRSRLWDSSTWPAEMLEISMGAYFAENEKDIETYDAERKARYATFQDAIDGKIPEETTIRLADNNSNS